MYKRQLADTTMLSLFKGDEIVGYYTNSAKTDVYKRQAFGRLSMHIRIACIPIGNLCVVPSIVQTPCSVSYTHLGEEGSHSE